MTMLSRWFDWRQALAIMRPQTLIRAPHQGFRVENQSHRTLQQHAEAASVPSGTRNVVVLQETDQPHWCHTAFSSATIISRGLQHYLFSTTMSCPLSEQRDVVVHDDPVRLLQPAGAPIGEGVAEPELEPLDPGDVPDDVEVTLTGGGESAVGRRVDPVVPLGVAQEHREHGNLETREQGAGAEVVPDSGAPRVLVRPIEVRLHEGEVTGPRAIGCP